MVDHPYYSGVMFMLFEDACRVQQDEPDVPPTKTHPAESRIYLKDFDTSRGTLPEFLVILLEFIRLVVQNTLKVGTVNPHQHLIIPLVKRFSII